MSADLIDLERYPVADLASPAAQRVVAEQRNSLRERGVCVLPGFVRPEVVADLVAESERLAPHGHPSDVPGTPYLELPSDGWPDGHPRITWRHTRLTAVGYDQFPEASVLRRLYEWQGLMDFVAAVLERRQLYRYADPMGALNLAAMYDGDELAWHYDQTDFVVSLAIQSSVAGGDFVSARRIRSADDERYDEVARILAGEAHPLIETLPMTPGTLMLFEGRWSLHAVTPIVGDIPRYVGLLAYDTEPGTMSSDLLRSIRYGRTEPVEPVAL